MLFQKKPKTVLLRDDFVQRRKSFLAPIPDANMSKHDRAQCVIAIVQDQPDWDYSLDNRSAEDNSFYGASFFAYRTPYTPEQEKLHNYLVKNLAGRRIATYAWGVYADICSAR